MSQEVATTQSNLPALSAMEEMGMSARDLLIPQLHLLQSTSDKVSGEGIGKLGDILNLQTNETVGGLGKEPLEIVPIRMYKTWTVYDASQTPVKFLRSEKMTAANEDQKWEGVEPDGTPVRRDYTINFFVLLRKELANGEAFPCQMSFKRTSLLAGKKIASQIFRLAALNKLPFSKSVLISVNKQQKEKNHYAVLEASTGTALDEKELAGAQEVMQMLKNVQVRVQEAPQEDERPAPPKPVVVETIDGDMPF